MSEEKINNDAAASEGDSGETLKKPGINWADHNDIMLVGMERYFAEIKKFVFGDKYQNRMVSR